MNTLRACATYVGEGNTEHGIRYIEVAVPAIGKGEDIKVRIIPNKAAGDVLGLSLIHISEPTRPY